MVKRFKLVGYAEAISFLLLLGVAMPLKYLYGMKIAVRIVGSLHGALFIAYAILANQLAQEQRWPGKKLAAALIAAVLPFGPLVFDRKFLKEG